MHKDLDKILITSEELENIINNIANTINKDYMESEVLLVVILKGSMVFASDLMRKLTMPMNLDFMKVSSYGNSTISSQNIDIKLDLQTDIKDKNVIIVEDIIDSGNTLFNLKNELLKRNPKSLKLCTLLDKPERRQSPIQADYVGTVIPDSFVVGYGLDYAEKYRELPYVGILSRRIYE